MPPGVDPTQLTITGLLLAAVAFLSKIALDYLADVKGARDEWRGQAKEATANLRDLTEAVLQIAPDLRAKLGAEMTEANRKRRAPGDR